MLLPRNEDYPKCTRKMPTCNFCLADGSTGLKKRMKKVTKTPEECLKIPIKSTIFAQQHQPETYCGINTTLPFTSSFRISGMNLRGWSSIPARYQNKKPPGYEWLLSGNAVTVVAKGTFMCVWRHTYQALISPPRQCFYRTFFACRAQAIMLGPAYQACFNRILMNIILLLYKELVRVKFYRMICRLPETILNMAAAFVRSFGKTFHQ